MKDWLGNWSTDNGWYAVALLLAIALAYCYAALRDANRRKKDLGEIAQNLNDQLNELRSTNPEQEP